MHQTKKRMEEHVLQARRKIPSAWKKGSDKYWNMEGCWIEPAEAEIEDLDNLPGFKGATGKLIKRRLRIDNNCLRGLNYPNCDIEGSDCYVPLSLNGSHVDTTGLTPGQITIQRRKAARDALKWAASDPDFLKIVMPNATTPIPEDDLNNYIFDPAQIPGWWALWTADAPWKPTAVLDTEKNKYYDVATGGGDGWKLRDRSKVCRAKSTFDKCIIQRHKVHSLKNKLLQLKNLHNAIEIKNIELQDLINLDSIPTAEPEGGLYSVDTNIRLGMADYAWDEEDALEGRETLKEETVRSMMQPSGPIQAAQVASAGKREALDPITNIKNSHEVNAQKIQESLKNLQYGNVLINTLTNKALSEERRRRLGGAPPAEDEVNEERDALEHLYINQLRDIDNAKELSDDIQDIMWKDEIQRLHKGLDKIARPALFKPKTMKRHQLFIDWISQLESRFSEAHEPTVNRLEQMESLHRMIQAERKNQIAANVETVDKFLEELGTQEMNRALGFGSEIMGKGVRELFTMFKQVGTRVIIQGALEDLQAGEVEHTKLLSGGKDWVKGVLGTVAGGDKDFAESISEALTRADSHGDWGGNITESVSEMVSYGGTGRSAAAMRIFLDTAAFAAAAGVQAAAGAAIGALPGGAYLNAAASYILWKRGLVQGGLKAIPYALNTTATAFNDLVYGRSDVKDPKVMQDDYQIQSKWMEWDNILKFLNMDHQKKTISRWKYAITDAKLSFVQKSEGDITKCVVNPPLWSILQKFSKDFGKSIFELQNDDNDTKKKFYQQIGVTETKGAALVGEVASALHEEVVNISEPLESALGKPADSDFRTMLPTILKSRLEKIFKTGKDRARTEVQQQRKKFINDAVTHIGTARRRAHSRGRVGRDGGRRRDAARRADGGLSGLVVQ